VADPAARQRILDQGADPAGTTPAEFQRLIDTEIARWASVIRRANVQVD
ncbi:MAG: tripartite tricarboxylate transporter substrate binding protein, partial [Gemmatimonadaceae bacterium]|nr:tripartite tricarboxylate transporter substrate binding protein [Acetobacteraceae bacterium]